MPKKMNKIIFIVLAITVFILTGSEPKIASEAIAGELYHVKHNSALIALAEQVPVVSDSAPAQPIETTTSLETKSLPLSAKENTSTTSTHRVTELTQHSWRAINDGEIFTFTQNGQFNIATTCANYTGKYKASDTGTILITELESTSNHCSKESKDTLMLNALILCQKFEISKNTLRLGADNKVLINLESSNINAPQYTPKKKHSNSHSKYKSHKQTRKTARSKNTKHLHPH